MEPMQAPLKQSPLFHVLRELGATFSPSHGWNMAAHFAAPDAEAAALKTGVGLADVSWLGKLELKGRQAALETLTIDEGKVWRLARGHCLIVCDPAGTDAISQSVENQVAEQEAGNSPDTYLNDSADTNSDVSADANSDVSADANSNVRPEPVEGQSAHSSTRSPRTDVSANRSSRETAVGPPCVHVIDVTSTYAGLLLAGPHSRDVLRRLAAPDVSQAALPNGSCLSAKVAGVHARALRDDLDDTLAYWLFVGAEYAAYAWEAVMHAGHSFGIVPVGSEAARKLRSGDS